MRLLAIVTFVVLGTSLAIAQESQVQAVSQKPLIAVQNFEFGGVQPWWEGPWNIGEGISGMLMDKLLESGSIRLLERRQLQAVIGEQDLATSGRVDPTTSANAATGKIISARYMVTGAVTQFGGEARDFNAGGVTGFFARRTPFAALAAIGTKKTTAHVELTTRVVDSTTGEILLSVKSAGQSKRSGLLLGGIGATNKGIQGGMVGIGSSEFRDTILGEATEEAVNDAATKLLAALSKLQ